MLFPYLATWGLFVCLLLVYVNISCSLGYIAKNVLELLIFLPHLVSSRITSVHHAQAMWCCVVGCYIDSLLFWLFLGDPPPSYQINTCMESFSFLRILTLSLAYC